MISGNFFGNTISKGRAATATLYWDGSEEVLAMLRRLPDRALMALGNSIRAELVEIKALSQDEYVPVETQQLQKAAYVSGPKMVGRDVVEVVIGYRQVRNPRGSAYTIPVHEIPEPPDKSVGGRSAVHEHGSWKFLEIPVAVRSPGMEDRINKNLTKQLLHGPGILRSGGL